MTDRKSLRIGGGLGFYGDSWEPIVASLERGNVQYIASDHLAELTLAILQKDRAKDPTLGYTRDLVPMLSQLWPYAMRANEGKGVKFVVNAGGLNPKGARAALCKLFAERGWHARIACVSGDDVLGRIDSWTDNGEAFAHMQTGVALSAVRERLVFANAYLGAAPIVEALRLGADIVITGRVADAALFLAPMIHEFGWALDAQTPEQCNLLAQGLAVGHLLECSGQVCGGNFGGRDWDQIPDLAHIGYPIAEVNEDGGAVIFKASGTGGRINFDTVREQLLYEVHDPANYISPDVVLDMSSIALKDLGDDRVSVTGAVGRPRPENLKIVAGYSEGWMGQANISYCWPQALQKARYAAQMVQSRLSERKWKFDSLRTEYVGYDSILGPLSDQAQAEHLNEVGLRMAVRTSDKRAAEQFSGLFPWLALSGPPFVAGRLQNHGATELLGVWPMLVPRSWVEDAVKVDVVEV